MEFTLDDLAESLISWCKNDSKKLKQYWSMKGGWEAIALNDFADFLKTMKRDANFDFKHVYNSNNSNALVFNQNSTDSKIRIIADLACESFDFDGNFITHILSEEEKMSDTNLKENYRNCSKCIIGLYFDFAKRNELHDRHHIEIFNNYSIGCTMKKLC